MDTEQIAKNYFQAWQDKDFTLMRSLLGSEFHFKGAIDEFHNADDTIAAFKQIGPLVDGIEMVQLLTDGNRVAAFYNFNCKEPLGGVPTAEYLKIEKGKIVESRIFFDPRRFAAVTQLPDPKQTV